MTYLGAKRADLDRADINAGGLAAFARLAWPHIEPSIYRHNWHHDILANALERVTDRECRKLSIWVPPGTTKTLYAGVLWPAWTWKKHPDRQTIQTTYGGNLALKAARKMRDLVNSNWYQSVVEGKVNIPYQNTHAAAFFENNCKGFRFSSSVTGEVTGRHAHDLVGDDLNKAVDAVMLTGAALNMAWTFWSEILPTRQADPQTTARMQIGQRIHMDDVGGRWTRSDPEVEVLCLPMRYEADHPHAHPDDPRADPAFFDRCGGLLWPDRFGEAEVAELERTLGPTAAAAQLQQRPIPPGGQLLKTEYLSHRYVRLTGRLMGWLEGGKVPQGVVGKIYGDMTFKGKATSDYVVYQFWISYQGQLYLIDQIRGQWGFRESKQKLRSFQARWPQASASLLEDAANAPAMVDDMVGEIPGLGLAPMQGGCLARTQQCEGQWAAGNVHLPEDAPWMGGSDGFEAEHLSYDGLGTRHDDQVATSSLAILDLSSGSAQAYNAAWGEVLANG